MIYISHTNLPHHTLLQHPQPRLHTLLQHSPVNITNLQWESLIRVLQLILICIMNLQSKFYIFLLNNNNTRFLNNNNTRFHNNITTRFPNNISISNLIFPCTLTPIVHCLVPS